MKRYVEFAIEPPGTTVIVEVEVPDEAGYERAARPGDLAVQAGQSFEQALEKVRPIAQAVLSKLRSVGEALDEVAVEFGLKLDGKWGVIVASGGVEANFKVALKWKRSQPKSAP
jgi:hypothetical protein